MALLTKFAKGAAAGLAASAAMHAFRIAWERIATDGVRDGIFGFDREADVNSAQWICGLVVRERLSAETAARLGLTLHYVYGALLGAAYSAARGRASRMSSALSIRDGIVLWLAADELPITLSGISNPIERSLRSHFGAAAAHVLYATAMRTILRCW